MVNFHDKPFHFNFVLLGKSGSGKSATANTILKAPFFSSERRTASATLDVQMKHGIVFGHPVIVYDTPGFCNIKLSEEQIREKCQSAFRACESEADICTYLLVIRIGRFTDEDRKTVETIENLLGEDRMKKTWILFTGGDELEDSTNKIEDFINELDAMKKLVQKYENRYHVFNNKMRGFSPQVQCLMNKVETASKNLKLLEENSRKNTSTHSRDNGEKEKKQKGKQSILELDSFEDIFRGYITFEDILEAMNNMHKLLGKIIHLTHFSHSKKSEETTTTTTMTSDDSSSERRIVILGKRRAGKSATGNTILGEKYFTSKFSFLPFSVTKQSEAGSGQIGDRNVCVIDTPGFTNHNDNTSELERSIDLSSPGPHAFLIVLRGIQQFREQDKQIIQQVEKVFGDEVTKYAIVLFTYGDLLTGERIEKLINENQALRELVQKCGGRYHIFNNADRRNREQVTELMEKIDRMVEQNGGSHYTH